MMSFHRFSSQLIIIQSSLLFLHVWIAILKQCAVSLCWSIIIQPSPEEISRNFVCNLDCHQAWKWQYHLNLQEALVNVQQTLAHCSFSSLTIDWFNRLLFICWRQEARCLHNPLIHLAWDLYYKLPQLCHPDIRSIHWAACLLQDSLSQY